jgi:hypothetical protein
MRRLLPVLSRALRHPGGILAGAAMIAVLSFAPVRTLTTETTGGYYGVALLATALASWAVSRFERALWPRPAGEFALLHAVTALGAALGIVALAAGLDWFLRGVVRGPLPVLGCLHLACLAQLVQRLPLSAGARAHALLSLCTVLPALVPLVRPWFDAGPSFQPAHFPRSIAGVAPILTLAVLSVALPSCRRSEPAEEAVA